MNSFDNIRELLRQPFEMPSFPGRFLDMLRTPRPYLPDGSLARRDVFYTRMRPRRWFPAPDVSTMFADIERTRTAYEPPPPHTVTITITGRTFS